MSRVLPPPQERFDPITARWLTPGGLLHDPQRDSLGPDGGEPVTLVEPVPRELAGVDRSTGHNDAFDVRARRRRHVMLAVVVLGIAAMIIGGFWV